VIVNDDLLVRAAEARSIAYSAVFSDVCDQLGARYQTLSSRLGRLTGSGTIVGFARTFTTVAVDEIPPRPYGGEIDFIDSLGPGDVAIGRVDAPAAAWGELFSAAATGRGAVGAVIDGVIRDREKVDALGFPILGTGTRPTDALGRVALGSPDVPVEIDGVLITTGDLIVADDDGVVVVPRALAAEVLDRALAKARTERDALALLVEGGTLADVWERFRVL
jgi:4-hydroxy-4-methyl-2-oxoglutarate aldolase